MVVVAFTAAAFTAAMAFMAVTFTAALRTTVLYRTDHSILGMGFVMIMTAFLDHHFVIGNTWPGYYDPYYLGSYDYDYPYEDYTAQDYSDVMPAESVSLAVQRAASSTGLLSWPSRRCSQSANGKGHPRVSVR